LLDQIDLMPLIELTNIVKSFGGVQALRGVDFALQAGSIHGLAGENGAGKSTLMKVIAGVHGADSGEFKVDGEPVHFRSARDARARGVAMVHQELSVAPDLSVAENVFLGAQPVTGLGNIAWGRMAREAAEQLKNLGLDIDPRARLGDFPIGVQQLVELARVLFSGARIIILDEPTSALSPPEIARLFEVLRRVRDTGVGIVFISHFLDDILEISDEVSVFRNGQRVAHAKVGPGVDKMWIIENMIGAGRDELGESYLHDIALKPRAQTRVVLEAEGLTLEPYFRNVSFNAHAGEVLGIYGFMGCGQIELARTLFGKLKAQGRLKLDGAVAKMGDTTRAKNAGVGFVPESRRMMLFREEPIYRNVSIAFLEHFSKFLVRPGAERAAAKTHTERLGVRPAGVEARLGALSGGNQQKVALAKWLTRPPKVLVLVEPTRGMDVGAKEDVVHIVKSLAAEGMAVIVLSTEPETVLSLADRVLVMRKGEIHAEFADCAISKDRLLAAA
jgi:ribose transport system ATP-binding protein